MFVGRSAVFFFKQKTAYEMRISDWSSDVCSSDLAEQCDCNRLSFGCTIATPKKRGTRKDRRMRKCLLATVVLVAPFFTSPAHAQARGFFARGSVGSSETNNAYAPFSTTNQTGIGVGLPWRVLPWRIESAAGRGRRRPAG